MKRVRLPVPSFSCWKRSQGINTDESRSLDEWRVNRQIHQYQQEPMSQTRRKPLSSDLCSGIWMSTGELRMICRWDRYAGDPQMAMEREEMSAAWCYTKEGASR